MELEDLINEEQQARKKLKELKENKTPNKVSHTKGALIFIGATFLIIIGFALLQGWANNTGHYLPKWPLGVIIVGLYSYLFRKK